MTLAGWVPASLAVQRIIEMSYSETQDWDRWNEHLCLQDCSPPVLSADDPWLCARDRNIAPTTAVGDVNPRATLRSFIDACNELYDLAENEKTAEDFNTRVLPAAQRIRDCLDLNALPGELRDTVGLESSVYLKEVLDRIELPEDDEIPDATAGEAEPVSRWRIPGTRLTIARVQSGPHEGAYLFSPETVRQAAKFYSAAKQLPYRNEGPRVSAGFQDRYVALTKLQPTLAADTSSPRGTLTLFLDKTNEVYELTRSKKYVDRTEPEFMTPVTQIFRCLDLSEVPEYSREYYASEVAACLKEVMDRVTLPPAEEIPGPEDVSALEGGEALARWQIPNTKITIGRIEEGPRRGEYLFTTDTVQTRSHSTRK